MPESKVAKGLSFVELVDRLIALAAVTRRPEDVEVIVDQIVVAGLGDGSLAIEDIDQALRLAGSFCEGYANTLHDCANKWRARKGFGPLMRA